jgi:hypothetical protein
LAKAQIEREKIDHIALISADQDSLAGGRFHSELLYRRNSTNAPTKLVGGRFYLRIYPPGSRAPTNGVLDSDSAPPVRVYTPDSRWACVYLLLFGWGHDFREACIRLNYADL